MASSAVLSTHASFVHLRWTNGGWIVIFLLFNPVFCQERKRISVSAGSDILLQCSYDPDPISPSTDVYWRYNYVHNLYDIISNQPDLSVQDQRFRNRTHTFPHLYAKGNFSVVLMNVSLNDTGLYECEILANGYKRKLHLIVRPETPPTEQPTETPTEEEEVMSPPGVSGGSGTVSCDVIIMVYMFSIVMFNNCY